MSELLNKVSSYNIFNYLFCGVVFVALAQYFTPFALAQDDLVIGIGLYYFLGLTISRLGSLIVEPVLEYLKFVKFSPYPEYLQAVKEDSQLELLSEINNMYRTLVAVICAILVLRVIGPFAATIITHQSAIYISLGVLLIIYLFSYRKQTQYITKRIKIINNEQTGN